MALTEAAVPIKEGVWSKRLRPPNKFLSVIRETPGNSRVDPDVLQDFFREEVEITKLAIAEAIFTGRYVPSTPPALTPENAFSKPQPASGISTGVTKGEDASELTKAFEASFAEKLQARKLLIYGRLFRRYGIDKFEGEEIFQNTVMRLLVELRSGRLSQVDLDNDDFIDRVLMRRSVFEAIEIYRKKHGRKGDRPGTISIEELNGENTSSIQNIGNMNLSYQELGFEEIESDYFEFVLETLPLLGESEREIFMLHTFFRLLPNEIGAIIDKTPQNIKSQMTHIRRKFIARYRGEPDWRNSKGPLKKAFNRA